MECLYLIEKYGEKDGCDEEQNQGENENGETDNEVKVNSGVVWWSYELIVQENITELHIGRCKKYLNIIYTKLIKNEIVRYF